VKLPGRARLIVLAYLVIFSASLFRGMILFGVQPASNDARGFVGGILAMLYFFTAPTDPQTIKKILMAYLSFGVGLVIVAGLHYAGLNVGTAVLDEKDRALPSASGEIIALCFFIGLAWITHRKAPQILRWLLPVFAGMAIILQHRTVWTVMAVCSIAILFIDFKLIRRLIPLAALASVIAVGLAIVIYRTGTEASAQFEDSATNEGTWNWRVEGWQNYVSDDTQTVPSMIFGQPMGSGYVRFDSASGGFADLPPHSEYIPQYLRVGILGLLLYLAFLLRPLLRLYELQRKDPLALFPSASVWCLIIVGILVYGITYAYDASAIALVGIANSALLSIKSHQREEPQFVFPIKKHALGLRT
jgi:O-antigen ligase